MKAAVVRTPMNGHVAHRVERQAFGGRAIEGFAQVMLYGVVICTYSAICISSPMLIYIGLRGSEAAKSVGGKVAPAE